MRDLDRIREFAQGILDEANRAVAEVGKAAATPELARAKVAEDLLALLDAIPPMPAFVTPLSPNGATIAAIIDRALGAYSSDYNDAPHEEIALIRNELGQMLRGAGDS